MASRTLLVCFLGLWGCGPAHDHFELSGLAIAPDGRVLMLGAVQIDGQRMPLVGTTQDGSDWALAAGEREEWFGEGVYANGLWLAPTTSGHTGRDAVRASLDGYAWTEVHQTDSSGSIAAAGHTVVVPHRSPWTGTDGVLVTTDGRDWHEPDFPVGAYFRTPPTVAAGNGFVVGGGNGLFQSNDGIFWRQVPLPAPADQADIVDVYWTGSHFLANAQDADNGSATYTLRSKHGLQWTAKALGEGDEWIDVPVDFRDATFGIRAGNLVTTHGLDGEWLDAEADFTPQRLLATDTLLIAAGQRAVMVTQDGATWQQVAHLDDVMW